MEIYQITYQEYIAFMQRLKVEIDNIINITPDNARKLMAIHISEMIENSIVTAQAEINLPSQELMNIVLAVKDIKTCGAPPIVPVLEAWGRSIHILSQAAHVLKNITDDTYLNVTSAELEALIAQN